MVPMLITLLLAVLLVVAVLVWRASRTSSPAHPPNSDAISEVALAAPRQEFPEAGLLVADDVLRMSDSTSVAIWDALEMAAVPVAVEYFPVSNAEIQKYRTVPINAAAQKAMVDVLNALNPSNPTLFRVVLPEGAELVKAVGASGFRGFARNGSGIASHAVLKPVAAGGAIAAGWPVFAVAGTVMAVDTLAQRELRAHQRKVEAILGRQEERHYIERIKDQRSADAQLTRAISLMLDGHEPSLDLALKSAYDEFHRSQQFLEKYRDVLSGLVDDEGKVDYRRLEVALGGQTKDLEFFMRELHMARGAIAIRRKALLTDAAAVALADPENPYTALRKFLDSQVDQLEDADTVATSITQQLAEIELKARWHEGDKSVSAKQKRIRALASTPEVDQEVQIQFLRTASGELVQVVAIEEAADESELEELPAND